MCALALSIDYSIAEPLAVEMPLLITSNISGDWSEISVETIEWVSTTALDNRELEGKVGDTAKYTRERVESRLNELEQTGDCLMITTRENDSLDPGSTWPLADDIAFQEYLDDASELVLIEVVDLEQGFLFDLSVPATLVAGRILESVRGGSSEVGDFIFFLTGLASLDYSGNRICSEWGKNIPSPGLEQHVLVSIGAGDFVQPMVVRALFAAPVKDGFVAAPDSSQFRGSEVVLGSLRSATIE